MKLSFNGPLFLAFLGLAFHWALWVVIILAVLGSFYWDPDEKRIRR